MFCMKRSLPVLIIALFICCNISFASNKNSGYYFIFSEKKDTLAKNSDKEKAPHILKICACQVLQLQSANHRLRNYAVYAERTNKKSLSYDVRKAKWIIEKEKKHLVDYFYDKMDVIDDLVEITDCKSLYIKMKKKHRTLVLYDILDADIKK